MGPRHAAHGMGDQAEPRGVLAPQAPRPARRERVSELVQEALGHADGGQRVCNETWPVRVRPQGRHALGHGDVGAAPRPGRSASPGPAPAPAACASSCGSTMTGLVKENRNRWPAPRHRRPQRIHRKPSESTVTQSGPVARAPLPCATGVGPGAPASPRGRPHPPAPAQAPGLPCGPSCLGPSSEALCLCSPS